MSVAPFTFEHIPCGTNKECFLEPFGNLVVDGVAVHM